MIHRLNRVNYVKLLRCFAFELYCFFTLVISLQTQAAHVDGNLIYYFYGEHDAPAGVGRGAQSWSTIVHAAKASGKPFEDPYFPADNSSLVDLDLVYADGRAMEIKWLRPTEIALELFKSKPIFHGDYTEFAVHQGSVGDCWILSVLADVAVQKDCLNTIMPTNNNGVGFEAGAFHFRFWCKAKWLDVVVDDRLPCRMRPDGSIQATVFSSPTANGGFWTSLLEKAYAKMYGGYSNIKGGVSADAMLDFTGGFVDTLSRNTPNDPEIPNLLETLKENKQLHAIMTISTMPDAPFGKETARDPDNPGNEMVSTDGIVLGHAYSLLDIQEVPVVGHSKSTITLLKLRNPWGTSVEWKGPFSDNDTVSWSKVTRDLRQKSKENLEDGDGEFWAPYDSFVRYIQTVDICRWSKYFRGDRSFTTKNGASYFVDFGIFSPKNSGPIRNSDDLRGKKGYYVHLKARSPTDIGEIRNGRNYCCGIIIDLIYLNYSRSGANPHIPQFGFYSLWAPGFIKPEGNKFFHHVSEFDGKMIYGDRRVSFRKNLSEGTVYIVPWTTAPLPKPTEFVIRIGVEGQVIKYPSS